MEQDSQVAESLSAGDIRCLRATGAMPMLISYLPVGETYIRTPGARPLFRLVYKPRP